MIALEKNVKISYRNSKSVVESEKKLRQRKSDILCYYYLIMIYNKEKYTRKIRKSLIF